jgi:hypothetical protein
MTDMMAREMIREAADNCGDQLDMWRQYHRDPLRLPRAILLGLVLGAAFWGGLFALYTYATHGGNW